MIVIFCKIKGVLACDGLGQAYEWRFTPLFVYFTLDIYGVLDL
jgi:hypothetical protein